MKNSFLESAKGFTLTEIIIAIAISVIVLGGVLGFLTKIQSDILISKHSTRVYTNLTDFTETMQNFNKLYGSGMVIVGGTGAYNVWLLMRPDGTSGVLIGVVEEKNDGISKLDPVSAKETYGKKTVAYRNLTASQIGSILVSTGSVYDIDFHDEWLFKDLTVTDFLITPYNSGSIMEYRIDVETPFYPELNGEPRDAITPVIVPFSFILDF